MISWPAKHAARFVPVAPQVVRSILLQPRQIPDWNPAFLSLTGPHTAAVGVPYPILGHTEELAASLQAVWDCPDGVSALVEWTRHIARSHPRILAIMLAIERAHGGDKDAADLRATVQGNWLKGSRKLIQWLADDGRLAPYWSVDAASDFMWALMSPDLLDRLFTERHWSRGQLAEHLEVLFQSTFVR